jgi:hypothetical protein
MRWAAFANNLNLESAGNWNSSRRRAAGRAKISRSNSRKAVSADKGLLRKEFQLIILPATSVMHPILPALIDPTFMSFGCALEAASQGRTRATFCRPDRPADRALRRACTAAVRSFRLRAAGRGVHSKRIPSAYSLSHVLCTAFHSAVGIPLAGNRLRWAQAAEHASLTSSDKGFSIGTAAERQ